VQQMALAQTVHQQHTWVKCKTNIQCLQTSECSQKGIMIKILKMKNKSKLDLWMPSLLEVGER
jgi:hypothetical protein